MDGPDVSIITVSSNTREVLRGTLEAAREHREWLRVEHFVVDNASTDGTLEMLRRDFPEITVIANTENVGPGRARNRALRRCRAPLVLNLDSDVIVRRGTIPALVEHMQQNAQVGAVGCELLHPDGSRQRSAFHEPNLLPAVARRARAVLGRPRQDFSTARSAVTAGWLKGAICLYRMAALKHVGGFDPQFFIYFEEVDLHIRLGNAGWRLVYLPTVSAVHLEGKSMDENFGQCQFEREINRLMFVKKHKPWMWYGAERTATAVRALYYSRACADQRLRRTFWDKDPGLLRDIYGRVLAATLPPKPLPLHRWQVDDTLESLSQGVRESVLGSAGAAGHE